MKLLTPTFIHTYICQAWYTQHMYLLFYWLAMSNCCVNPLVYYWMNRRFRDYFNQALCCTTTALTRTYTTRSTYWVSDTCRSVVINQVGSLFISRNGNLTTSIVCL